MTEKLKDKYAGKFIDASNVYDIARGQGMSRAEMIPLIRNHTDRMLILAEKIAGENGGPDPVDPPDPITGTREFLQIDGMGVFLWFLMYYWDSETRGYIKERAAETLEFFASYKPSSLAFFCWMRNASADNAHFRPSCPYPTNANGKFDLNNIKDKYLRAASEWASIAKGAGLTLQPCINMNPRYCGMPFAEGNNINGSLEFYHDSARPFQIDMIDAWINIIISVNGEIREIRTINEPEHHSHNSFHRIDNWVRDSYRETLAIEKVPIKGFFVDETSSAAVLAPFLERHDCPKYNPSQPEPLCPDGKIGGDLNGGSTDPADRLPVAIINHGYSILEDKHDKEGQESYMGSAWPFEGSWWAGGDGGTRFKEKARGHRIHENDDPAHPYILFAQGDGPQTRELVGSVIEDGVAARRRCGYQLAFFEHLMGWPLKENCNVEVFHRDRFDGAAKGYDDGGGPISE